MNDHILNYFNALYDSIPLFPGNPVMDVEEPCLIGPKPFRQFLLFGKAQLPSRKWSKNLKDFITLSPEYFDSTKFTPENQEISKSELTYDIASGIRGRFKNKVAISKNNYQAYYNLISCGVSQFLENKEYHINYIKRYLHAFAVIEILKTIKKVESPTEEVVENINYDPTYLTLNYLKEDFYTNFVNEVFNISTGWTYYYPLICDEQELKDIKDKAEHQCKPLGLEIKKIAKVNLAYRSDGQMETSFNAWNNPRFFNEAMSYISFVKSPNELPQYVNKALPNALKKDGAPFLYLGECYAIEFEVNHVDPLKGNVVFITTPEQFKWCLETYQPGLLPTYEESPFKDIIYICNSQWCERNRPKDFDSGYNLSDPLTRRMSLFDWICGPLNTKHYQSYQSNLVGSKLEVESSANRAAEILKKRYQNV